MVETDTHDDKSSESSRDLTALLPQLFIAFECDRPLAGSSRHSLASTDEIVVGRGDSRHATHEFADGIRRLVVRVPGRSMSARHGRIFPVGSQWAFEDCGSTNGSFRNGERVTCVTLADGDILELGHTLFIFRAPMPITPDAPSDVDSTQLAGRPMGLSTLHPARASELEALERVAASPLSVVLIGESGTGKELLAAAVHAISGRKGRLVAVNCGALTTSLLESQLFGHVRGAFSGAVRDETGLIRSADGGTLFLDEIGDLAPASQAALLRVLQEGEVLPVGASVPHAVDLRVVAATHRPLGAMAERGDFRPDLLARLDGFTHLLPPLRARVEDLGMLIADMLPRVSEGASPAFSVDAARALFLYSWVGNVRELRQCLARAIVLANGKRIAPVHLPPNVARALEGRAGTSRPPEVLDEGDEAGLRRELIRLLEQHDGNVSEVARAMGKARMQIHRWMKRFGIDGERFRRM